MVFISVCGFPLDPEITGEILDLSEAVNPY